DKGRVQSRRLDHAVFRFGAWTGDGYPDCACLEIASAGLASWRSCRNPRCRTGSFPQSSAERYGNMSIELLTCILITIGALVYVFYLPGKVYLGPEKTRVTYLSERKEAIYENLRDLNFE